MMRSNSAWFESPFPHPPAFHPAQAPKVEPEEPEESHLMRPVFYSPEPIPPLFRNFNALTPLSLWTKTLHPEPDGHHDSIAADRLVPGDTLKREEIN